MRLRSFLILVSLFSLIGIIAWATEPLDLCHKVALSVALIGLFSFYTD